MVVAIKPREIDGVRGGDAVQLICDEDTGRIMLRAINEGGFACTDVDLRDLLGWLHRLRPTAVDVDELASALTVFATGERPS